MRRANQVHPDHAVVLVIDIQEKLLPLVRGHDRLVASCSKLLEGCRVFQLPVVCTEQYRKGIGATVAPIQQRLDAAKATVLEKMAFSAWAASNVRETLIELDRNQVILVGIEAHVCVQQTALDLLSRDYDVFVCADGVGSRGAIDYETSLERMRQEGVFVTTVESVLFELCDESGTPRFKEMIEVIKAYPPEDI